MGPPAGAPRSGRSLPEASSETKHRSGEAPRDRLRIVSGKRDGQHAEYHESETKRRKSGALRAANIQQKATDLVQQIASLGEPSMPQGSHETKVDNRTGGYSTFRDGQLPASSEEQARRSTNPTEGLHMQTGHYTASPSPDPDSDPAAAAEAPGIQTQQASSSEQVDLSSETDAESPAIEAYKQVSKAKQAKQALEESSDSQASKERQEEEQTNQIHQQNDPEEEKSLPPVIQKLQQAQQRAHDQLEAAEKESSSYRFPAEAGARFASNARKHKAQLDVAVYEHGRAARARSLEKK